jgi:hypothetical protein
MPEAGRNQADRQLVILPVFGKKKFSAFHRAKVATIFLTVFRREFSVNR